MIAKRVPAAALIACAMCFQFPHALASPPPDWLNCPDVVEIDVRTAKDRGVNSVRQIAPKAGGGVSADLSGFTHYSMLSYEMYDAFDLGEDPSLLMPASLEPIALLYADPGRDTERRRDRDLRDTETFYGFVADEKATGRRLIVVRGTLQPNEWLRNLQARQSPYPAGEPRWRAVAKVHSGFLKIHDSLEIATDRGRSPLAEALPALVQGQETVIVGHSLGGALATLIGVDAARLAPSEAARLRVVTFGSPRVGDEGFGAMAQAVGRIDRICNQPDPVTAVPPSVLLADYAHVGQVFRVSSFDWPELGQDFDRGRQVLCWHSIYTYRYMTDPEKTVFDELRDCLGGSSDP